MARWFVILVVATVITVGAGSAAALAKTPTPSAFPSGDTACPRPAQRPPIIEWIRTPGPVGTPIAPIPTVNPATHGTKPPEVKLSHIPNGPAADAATVAAITQVLAEINTCFMAPSDQVEAYFSEAFFRRTVEIEAPGTPDADGLTAEGLSWGFFGFQPGGAPPRITRAWVLPDGRIGAITQPVDSDPIFFAFVRSADSGYWLVDEEAFVINDLGTPSATP